MDRDPLVPDGQCLCGAVTLSLTGPPRFSVLCHCQDCQRISGGSHLPQAAFGVSCVALNGLVKTYDWRSDADNALSLGTCETCASPLFKTTSKMPDTLFIPVGLLRDQSVFHAPHVAYGENCPSWDRPYPQ